MGKKRFNKKESVRFALVPGIDENGNPSNTFKPIDTKSKLSVDQKKKIINQFGDYANIQINGKPVDQSQIPSYILQQIKGRLDLTINTKDNYDQQQMQIQESQQIQQQYQQQQQEDQWIDVQQQDQWIDVQQQDQWIDEQQQEIQQEKKVQKKLNNQNQLPSIKKVQFEGKNYNLSEEQVKLLDCVLPQNYQQYQIKGIKFPKFNQDGNRLDQKQAYEKYIIEEDTKRAVVDSVDYAPKKMVDFMDNDLKPSQIKGDVKQIQDALNYDGQEEVYEQLQDDFFVQLMKGNDQGKVKEKKDKKQEKSNPMQNAFKKKPKQIQKKKKQIPVSNKWQQLQMTQKERKQLLLQQQQITDDMLQKALQDFQNNKEYENQSFSSFSIADIQSRQQYMGKDGELDWRVLTKKQKKQYMKNKKIRQFHQQLRERQIQEKMKGKKNVSVQQLHLKTHIEHIPYKQDHVMQEAIKNDLQTPVNFDQQSDFETQSDEDDIISYKQKTSIISSNLATVQELPKKKKKQKKNNQEQEVKNIKRIKVASQKRNKNETKQQRTQRKQKLKQMKKQKRSQKQQFIEQFQSLKKKQAKKDNAHNTFHKVSYVKIA